MFGAEPFELMTGLIEFGATVLAPVDDTALARNAAAMVGSGASNDGRSKSWQFSLLSAGRSAADLEELSAE